ncbi:MAG: CoA transferase [Dehalococcoidia bacterium]
MIESSHRAARRRAATAPFPPPSAAQFQSLNRGKRSIVLNLHDARARGIVHRLLPSTDVVLVNYRADAARRMGIDYDTLRGLRPDLIYVQNTAFGVRGPRATQTGSDLMMAAYSGLIAHDGKMDEAGRPLMWAIAYSDYATGLAMAMGICAALFHRALTGEGQHINTSLLRTALAMQCGFVMRDPFIDPTDRDPLMQRLNDLRAAGAPFPNLLSGYLERREAWGAFRLYYGGYKAKDGALVFGALTQANRDAIRRVLRITDDTIDHPDFDAAATDSAARVAAMRETIQETLLARTVADWLADFDAAGAPVAPVQFAEEMADDAQVAAIGVMVDVEHDLTGPQRIVGPLLEMSTTPPRVQGAAPPTGRHTDAILAELGYSAAEIDDLRATGAVEGAFQ